MKKILIISFSNLKTDARVSRQVVFLKNQPYDLTVACHDANATANVNLIKLKPISFTPLRKLLSGLLLLSRLYSMAHRFLYGQKLNLNADFDLIIANDVESLPLAYQLKGNAKVLFDAHEYAPRHFEDRLMWRIFFKGFNEFLCRKYIHKVDAMITIGEGIAQEYEKNFHVKPIILTNATYYYPLEPRETEPHRIKLVHQGMASPSRKLELMFEMMNHLDERFTLDLFLVQPVHRTHIEYLEHIKKLAEKDNRIRFIPPVPSKELIATLNKYDVGIVLIPPVNFNYRNTLPNKFFECIQARIALAIGPIPEMKKITEEYNIGIVSEDFSGRSLADKLTSLSIDKINQFKNNTTKAAHEMNAEKNETQFNSIVHQLIES